MSDELQHYGVKGMKWGVRKAHDIRIARNAPVAVATKQKPGDFVQSKGGQRHAASTDAVKAQTHRQLAKASTTDSLSNKELQELVTRMNLEQQYSRLKKQEDRRTRGKRAVGSLLGFVKNNPDQAREAGRMFSEAMAANKTSAPATTDVVVGSLVKR